MVLCQEVLYRHKDQLLLCHHDIVLFVIPFLNEFYAFIYSGAVIVFVARKKFCIMMHAGFGFSASVLHSLASRKRYALWSFFEPAKTAVCFMFWTCVASEEVLPTMILLSKWNIGKGAFKYIGLYRVAAS